MDTLHHYIPSWYITLARTLRLYIVYPLVLFGSLFVLAWHCAYAVYHAFTLCLSLGCFTTAYLINRGYGRGNIITRALFHFFVFLEIPNHNDNNAGLAYFFMLLVVGALLLLGQLAYWMMLIYVSHAAEQLPTDILNSLPS